MSKFKSGDQVKLLSGGPAMTVKATVEHSEIPNDFLVLCTWFESRKVLEHSFNESQLEFCKDNPEKIIKNESESTDEYNF